MRKRTPTSEAVEITFECVLDRTSDRDGLLEDQPFHLDGVSEVK